MDHPMRWVVIIVAVLVILLIPLILPKSQPPAPPPQAPPMAAPIIETPPKAPPRPPIPESILDKLLYGMTYEQVCKLVGGEADETESKYDKGEPGLTSPSLTLWRIWKNEDGSSLQVGFLSNKLDQKRFQQRNDTPPEKENNS